MVVVGFGFGDVEIVVGVCVGFCLFFDCDFDDYGFVFVLCFKGLIFFYCSGEDMCIFVEEYLYEVVVFFVFVGGEEC